MVEQHLHGGLKGFDKAFWNIVPCRRSCREKHCSLTYTSKDMDEGYPGNLDVTVFYTLTDDNKVIIRYKATTDKKTVVNLTSHSYFNLTGNCKRDVLDHQVEIIAREFVPIEKTLIPSGELRLVKNTAFDFLEPHTIGSRIDSDDEQLVIAGGYDHTFVLKGNPAIIAATVVEPSSGRVMEVYTSEPGVQFYTGISSMVRKENTERSITSDLVFVSRHNIFRIHPTSPLFRTSC